MKAGRFLTAAMIVFALVVVPTVAYVGGYYGLAIEVEDRYFHPDGKRFVARYYTHAWQARLFQSAAKIEDYLTGNHLSVLPAEARLGGHR